MGARAATPFPAGPRNGWGVGVRGAVGGARTKLLSPPTLSGRADKTKETTQIARPY